MKSPLASAALLAALLHSAESSAKDRDTTNTIPVAPLRADNRLSLGSSFDLSFGGFIKIDALYSEFDRGESITPTGRDFFVPAAIPVGAVDNVQRSFDAHAKETRFFVKGEGKLENGTKVGTYLEFDFLVNQGSATTAVTNAYNPGLRRAFLTYGNWLIGQEWSTFQNLTALPEGLDFIGPSEGSPFGRQPMLRYSHAGWQIALENSETSLLANGGGSRVLTDDNTVPDLVVRYDLKGDFGTISFAALARELRSSLTAPAALASKGSAFSSGFSAAGKINLGADDLRFAMSGGRGIGRYIGINTITDAVVDDNGELEPIPLAAAYLAYRHAWNKQWRSTATISVLAADNDTDITGTAVTERVDSYHLNLLYSPSPKITFGVEGMSARRDTGELFGYLRRVQFSAKYAF